MDYGAFEEFHRPGISLEKVVDFRAEYSHRMKQWKWEEHQFRYLRVRRMRLRRPLGELRKKLSAMSDPTPQAVPVSVSTTELQRMAEWYRSRSPQRNRVPLVTKEPGASQVHEVGR